MSITDADNATSIDTDQSPAQGRCQGVRWEGTVHCTLPEVVLDNELSFYDGKLRGEGFGHVWSLTRQFAKYGELGEFAASVGHQQLKGFHDSREGGLSP